MRKFAWKLFVLCLLSVSTAHAQHMVSKESPLRGELSYLGLTDYPPFSYYEKDEIHSIFLKPMRSFSEKYRFELKQYSEEKIENMDFKRIVLKVRSGECKIFLGAYSDTKMFKGLNIIYPAVVSNPLHVISLPAAKDKIKSADDLKKYKGMAIKTEYFSDFVMRKIQPLNLEYVESPYEAYEKLFTGEADYIIGSLYYNKIMASRLGIEQYLSYSKFPLYKIPVFVALSRQTPMFTLYSNMLKEEMSKPEFADNVKKEILRVVSSELEKNRGVVPPAFVKKAEIAEEEPVADIGPDDEHEEDIGGQIVHEEIKGKTIEEVLEGL